MLKRTNGNLLRRFLLSCDDCGQERTNPCTNPSGSHAPIPDMVEKFLSYALVTQLMEERQTGEPPAEEHCKIKRLTEISRWWHLLNAQEKERVVACYALVTNLFEEVDAVIDGARIREGE